MWVRLVERHTCGGLLSAIRTTVDEARAEVVVSTVHKAKGRQWPKVRIWNDFPEPRIDKVTGLREPLRREGMMLVCVAVTRAQERLDNDGLSWIGDAEYLAQLPPTAAPEPVSPAARPVPLIGRRATAPDPLPEPVCETAPVFAL